MLSLTLPLPQILPSHHRPHFPLIPRSSRLPSPSPSPSPSPPPNEIYQPFRPPPTPLPSSSKYHSLSLSLSDRIDILRNRLGLWHDYAPLISSLSRDGFTPPSIEDLTGISPLDQNRLAVSSSVRLSLLPLLPHHLLPFFDSPSAADLLYHLRLLSTSHRAAAAQYLALNNLDGNSAEDIARAMKDFRRRHGDDGWEFFSGDSPGDCLAYTQFRLSREVLSVQDKLSALQKALEVAETGEAKGRIGKEIDKVSGKGDGVDEEDEKLEKVKLLQVVRLRYGEVAEAASVVVLPVSRTVDGVKEAPWICKWDGELGVVESDKGWKRWVVLPGWAPVMGLGGEGGVAVEFGSSKVLPWRVRKWEEKEGVVVVVDRKRNEVNGDGFYLVSGKGEEGEGGLRVERVGKLAEEEEVLGAVVLVVRPPKEDDDQLSQEDWD